MSNTETTEASLRAQIIEAYWSDYLEEGHPPASVFKLAKTHQFTEAEFFGEFASLSALEAVTWEQLVLNTLNTLQADEDYPGYPARQKLLAFAYTYLEHALGQRSRLLAAFPRFQPGPVPAVLKKHRKAFQDWAESLVKEAIASKEIADRKQLSDRYPDLLFGWFWYVCDYHLRDDSEQFQDTDALIEKSVNTFFDGAGNQFFDSAFDLAKFLLGRR